MKVNLKAIAKAIVILVVFTVLPIYGQKLIPAEFQKAFTIQIGIDVVGLLNTVAVGGVAMAVLVLLRGHLQKVSAAYLVVSSVWKVFWLFVLFFILGAGHPETLGLLQLGGAGGPATNTVVFDFRFFALLATVVVALMIVRSVLQFQEANKKTAGKEEPSNQSVSVPEQH
jgi:hypothetical protein